MHIAVLGAGLVGNAIVKDLASDPEIRVTAVDINPTMLEKLAGLDSIEIFQADLSKTEEVAACCVGMDLVINAVPGFMGYETLKQVILNRVNVVDISFFEEEPFELDDLAKARGVTAVMDCGVAPGLCNVIVGYLSTRLDTIDRYVCYVGGLPQVRQWPYEYKAVFSPLDVLAEYTRPARFVEHGQVVIRPALSDVELIDFPKVGTLEAFNTDGLRTLVTTMPIPHMREKTMRYPGHANLARIFRESGFFDETPVDVEGQMVRPIALTSKLLFKQWAMEEGEEDVTVMQVLIEGSIGERQLTYTFNLLDWYDRETVTTSMARTTGYTATLVARQVLKGLFDRPGISPPEFLGQSPGCYEDLLAGYLERGIVLEQELIETIKPVS
jgi:saccharopine dehydrogenase-like NADP-dependent oxidoreductase